MKAHSSSLLPRMIRAASRVQGCQHRVVAAGIDFRGRIIGLATNRPRLQNRGWHAEEWLLYRSPRSLSRILLVRVNKVGELLPIEPCAHCAKLANRRGVVIEAL